MLLGTWLVYELVNDPYEQRKSAALANRIDAAPGGVADRTELPAGLDYESIQQVITSKQRLWRPLVQKPKALPKKPNLKSMIQGLEIRAVLSEGNELKCIIRDKNAQTSTVYKKGDKVRELTLEAVTPTEIILSYKGQTIKLSL